MIEVQWFKEEIKMHPFRTLTLSPPLHKAVCVDSAIGCCLLPVLGPNLGGGTFSLTNSPVTTWAPTPMVASKERKILEMFRHSVFLMEQGGDKWLQIRLLMHSLSKVVESQTYRN